ncbi:redoxin family protein [Sphingomonas sp. FW199]|uniref:redoxin family protein n=1 Tax=Sphingomonas sp. FW199 TaxID=3400217 RepID=UPI003CFA668B
MNRWLIWAPLIAFAALVVLFVAGLQRDPQSIVASKLVGKPVPALALPALIAGKPGLDKPLSGPRLINVFASWCVPCAAEAPQLMALKQRGVTIDAVAIRDTAPAATQFLNDYGDPYRAIGDDRESRFQLSLGSAGVPETFVVDAGGIIRAQHIGPIRDEDVPKLIAALEAAR